jgi:uncharacterized membrane protein
LSAVDPIPAKTFSRYQQAQLGHLLERESFGGIWRRALAGQARAILTLGLYALTLVPLARVAFCLMLFIKQRDLIYVAFTAYVLAGLIAGIVLGSAG